MAVYGYTPTNQFPANYWDTAEGNFGSSSALIYTANSKCIMRTLRVNEQAAASTSFTLRKVVSGGTDGATYDLHDATPLTAREVLVEGGDADSVVVLLEPGDRIYGLSPGTVHYEMVFEKL